VKIKAAEFVTSAVKPAQYPPADWPELAFAGRSNVGKSSLINRLVNRRGLVRTSSTPGRTQLLNFFVVNAGQLGLVDLPGYGYAKAPVKVRAAWGPMIRTYIKQRANLKGVVLILDSRHGPTPRDLEFLDWLRSSGRPVVLVATKVDKLKSSRRAARLRDMAQALPRGAPEPIPFSALDGQGLEELWTAIEKLAGL